MTAVMAHDECPTTAVVFANKLVTQRLDHFLAPAATKEALGASRKPESAIN